MSSLGKCIHHQKASPVIEEQNSPKTCAVPAGRSHVFAEGGHFPSCDQIFTRSLVTVLRFLQQGALFPFISWHLFFVLGVIISSSEKTELILFL